MDNLHGMHVRCLRSFLRTWNVFECTIDNLCHLMSSMCCYRVHFTSFLAKYICLLESIFLGWNQILANGPESTGRGDPCTN